VCNWHDREEDGQTRTPPDKGSVEQKERKERALSQEKAAEYGGGTKPMVEALFLEA